MKTTRLASVLISRAAILLALAFVHALRGADYQATVLRDGPVGYWRLGESSGNTATNLGSLGPAANGVLINNVTLGQPGAFVGDANTAANFNGTSAKIDVPYAAERNATVFTMEVWANVLPASSGYRSPLTTRDDTPAGNTVGAIFYADPGDNWQFWSGRGSVGWHNLGGATVSPGEWAYLVGAFDGTTKRYYVNGLEVGSSTPAFGLNGSYPLRVGGGATEGDGNYFFEGNFDEVGVYSKVLTPEQILQHFVAGSYAPSSAPTLSVARTSAGLVLTWTGGTLQEAGEVTGAWQNLTGAASPLTVTPSVARKFCRVKQ